MNTPLLKHRTNSQCYRVYTNLFSVSLLQEDLSVLRSLVKDSASSPPNSTLWFSHYPSATIAADHTALRQLMASSVAHVCGHLHNLLGYMSVMYSRHPSGHLELELIDFKDNRGSRGIALCVLCVCVVCMCVCMVCVVVFLLSSNCPYVHKEVTIRVSVLLTCTLL